MASPSTITKSAASDVEATIAEPRSLEESGLSLGFLSDLAIKMLYFQGTLTGFELAELLRLPFHPVIEKLLEFIKREQLCQIRGSGSLASGSFQYVITDMGREKAKEVLERNQYVGPAPVPLAHYSRVAASQTLSNITVTPQVVRQGLSHLILSDETVKRIGVAVNSGQAIFLYGLPGNGKTVIAEAIGQRILPGSVLVPYAVEVDGQVIKVLDPVLHERIEASTEATLPGAPKKGAGLLTRADQRWVRCARPVVIAGGELVMESLDLNYNPVTRYYEAPLQMKANGGVFLIDDFGRQLVRPRDLLNRWIVPLEKQVDFLTLHTGKKFEIPFEELIIFATNLEPKTLVDEAFLRRIRYKVNISNPTADEFHEIFRQMCLDKGATCPDEIFSYLLENYYVKAKRGLRSCHPRDLIQQALDAARFQGQPPRLTKELIDFACSSYFVEM